MCNSQWYICSWCTKFHILICWCLICPSLERMVIISTRIVSLCLGMLTSSQEHYDWMRIWFSFSAAAESSDICVVDVNMHWSPWIRFFLRDESKAIAEEETPFIKHTSVGQGILSYMLAHCTGMIKEHGIGRKTLVLIQAGLWYDLYPWGIKHGFYDTCSFKSYHNL